MKLLKKITHVKIIVPMLIVTVALICSYIIYGHKSQSNVTMTVTYSGGSMCENMDEIEGCITRNNIYTDGTFEKSTNLDSSELSELKRVIDETDFSLYNTNPRPNCPSYTDGIDISLSFPQKYSGKKFKLCTLEIDDDDPAINFIIDLINKHGRNSMPKLLLDGQP